MTTARIVNEQIRWSNGCTRRRTLTSRHCTVHSRRRRCSRWPRRASSRRAVCGAARSTTLRRLPTPHFTTPSALTSISTHKWLISISDAIYATANDAGYLLISPFFFSFVRSFVYPSPTFDFLHLLIFLFFEYPKIKFRVNKKREQKNNNNAHQFEISIYNRVHKIFSSRKQATYL